MYLEIEYEEEKNPLFIKMWTLKIEYDYFTGLFFS